MKKRILSSLMAFVMLLSLLPVSGLAAEAEPEEVYIHPVSEPITLEGVGSIYDVVDLASLPAPANIVAGKAFDKSYYNQLDPASKAIYDAIYANDSPLKAGPTTNMVTATLTGIEGAGNTLSGVTVTVKKLNTSYSADYGTVGSTYISNTIWSAIGALLYDHPELSWLVNTGISISYDTDFRVGSSDFAEDQTEKIYSNQTVTIKSISLGMSAKGVEMATKDWSAVDANNADDPATQEVETVYSYANTENRVVLESKISAAKTAIDKELTASSTPYDKVVAIHNWICSNMEYANQSSPLFTENWRGYQTAHSALVGGITVCAGYAKSFKLLCDEYSIPCVIATGIGAGGAHAWNYVQLDNAWYGVDCTWDDQKSGMITSYFLIGSDNFLGDGSEVSNTHKEGTLFSTYKFAYPTLSTSDYVPTQPEPAFVVIYDKNGTPVETDSVTLAADGDTTVSYTAKVLDEKENALDGYKIYWGLVTGSTGVTVIDGVVTIPSTASGEIVIEAQLAETTLKAELKIKVVQPHTHTWATTWSTSSTHHWHECTASDCQEKNDYEEHTWDTSVDTKVPTCTETGIRTLTCKCGETKTETIPATGHKPGDKWVTAEDSTTHWHVCSVCSAKLDETAHTWDDGETTTEPTCTAAGEKTFTCTACGATKTEEIGATGHKWDEGEVTKPATCTEDGVKTYTCSVCKETKTEVITKLGHKWSTKWTSDGTNHWHVCENGCSEVDGTAEHDYDPAVITKEPTYDAAGEKTSTCKVCGYQKTETVPALTHSYSNVWSSDDDKHWHVCTDAGYETLKSGEDAHNWGTGVETIAATFEAAGLKTYTCSVCGATKTETIDRLEHTYAGTLTSTDPYTHWYACEDTGYTNLKKDEAAHDWGTGETTKEPTETEAGEMTYTCGCGATKVVAIGALNHNYDTTKWVTDDNNHWHACTDEDCTMVSDQAPHTWTEDEDQSVAATIGQEGSKVYVCGDCGKTKTVTVPAHTAVSTWSMDATNHWHACTECDEIADKAEHTWGEGVETTPATLDKPGVKTYTCTVCGAEKTEAIPQLGYEYSTEWSKDPDYHWHACTTAGHTNLRADLATHTWNAGEVTDAPTTEATGVKTFTCTVCGQTRTETIPVLDPEATIFTVTFNAQGGTASAATMPTGADGKLASLPTATRSGYTFNGWFTDASGGTKITTDTVFDADATVYAQWTAEGGSTPGGSTGGGTITGGGSTGGSTTTPTVTVPVSGDQATVQVSATVSGNTATVSKIDTKQIENVIGDDVRSGLVEIDFTGLGTTIDTVNLPADAVREIAAAAQAPDNDVSGLSIKLSGGEIAFNADALAAIQSQAGTQITLTVAPAKSSDLNARQREVVGSAPVFDLTVKSGGKTITSFGSGYATVSLPYALQPGQNPAGIVVYYLDNNGNIQACETMYDVRTQTVIFTTGHLSLYFVGYDEQAAAAAWENPFQDVRESDWFYDAVRFVSENGLMNGYSGGALFGPNDNLSRAQLAQILYNKEGRPAVAAGSAFTDVPAGEWYADAVNWAAANGIVTGYGDGRFGPNDNITREQLAVMLWRYAGKPAAATRELSFSDNDKISSFAFEALYWAVENGVMSGYSGMLDPTGFANRGQVAQMLMNYLNQ